MYFNITTNKFHTHSSKNSLGAHPQTPAQKPQAKGAKGAKGKREKE